MNIFVTGWNLPKERHSMALTELRRMTETFPQLDPETLWHFSSTCGTIFTASLHTADQLAAPRRYVTQCDDQVVFYSGLPVNSTGDYFAHRAEALAAHWGQLTENIEGQYVIMRATDEPLRLEVITDILGMEQVFYFHQGDMWLISNSVCLIEQISKPSALDPLGVSVFLSVGSTGADRTLRRDIKMIPGGQYWAWQEGDIEPRRQSHFTLSSLAHLPRRAPAPSDVERLADELTQLCRGLSQGFDEIQCPLTGGRDSRLLAALLIYAGLPVQYFTAGRPSSADVKIGKLIAKTFNLPHEVIPVTTSDVTEKWDEVCWQYVRQNDGMSSLWQIGDVVKGTSQAERLIMSLWGAGGEMARGSHHEPQLFLGRQNIAGIQRFLIAREIKAHGGLLHQNGIVLAQDYLRGFVAQCVDEGFAPLDAPDIFYTCQHVGRWVGSNARRMMAAVDFFSPYCSRPFIRATFAMPALHRYTETLHYKLTRMLSPKLHSMPFDKKPWRSQRPVMNLLHLYGVATLRKARRRIPDTVSRLKPKKSSKKTMTYARSSWVEAKREQIREVCLDQSDSLLWNFVDRAAFERITSAAADPADRSHYKAVLFRIATLFYYEADHQRCSSRLSLESDVLQPAD